MEEFSKNMGSAALRALARSFLYLVLFTISTQASAQSFGSYSDWLTRKQTISTALLERLAIPGSESFLKEYLGFGSEFCQSAAEGEIVKASPKAMIERARNREARQDFCGAASIYMEMRKHYPFDPFWTDSGIRAVMAYIQAGDYLAAINEANDMYDVSGGSPYQETLHLLMITTVYKRMLEHGVENSQEWTRYLLGIDSSQTDGNVYLGRLSFRSFERDFSESQALPLLQKWKADARNRYADSFMKTGLRHKQNNDQLAAILSFMGILRIGPVVKVFPQATFETIESYMLFSRMIRDPRKVNDARLREWLKLGEDEPLDRKAAADQTLDQARKVLALMKENLPNDPWTAKASRLPL